MTLMNNVAFDLDGVCLNFYDHFCRFIRDKYGAYVLKKNDFQFHMDPNRDLPKGVSVASAVSNAASQVLPSPVAMTTSPARCPSARQAASS